MTTRCSSLSVEFIMAFINDGVGTADRLVVKCVVQTLAGVLALPAQSASGQIVCPNSTVRAACRGWCVCGVG